jgi:hypothetical protein
MKRYAWLLAIAGSLLVTVWALRAPASTGQEAAGGAALKSDDSDLRAAWQYHHRQARHWRECLLQH